MTDRVIIQDFRGHQALFQMLDGFNDKDSVVWLVEFRGHSRTFTYRQWCNLGAAWIVATLPEDTPWVRAGNRRRALRMLEKAGA